MKNKKEVTTSTKPVDKNKIKKIPYLKKNYKPPTHANVIMAMHFGKDENKNIVVNNTKTYMWRVPYDDLFEEIDRGDIVRAVIKTKDKHKKGVEVIVTSKIKNWENVERVKLRRVLCILEKAKTN